MSNWKWTAIVLVAVTPALAMDAQGRVGRLISYQGQASGVSGAVTVMFRVYRGGVSVWGPEEHAVTLDEQGRFVTVIGSTNRDLCTLQPNGTLSCTQGDGIPDLDQLDGDGLEIEVSVQQGANPPTVLAPRQKLVPAFHAATANVAETAPGVVPVGGVVMWWGTLPPPAGWELCDGSMPSTPGATLVGKKPNLLDRFPKGATAQATDVTNPVTGGTRGIDTSTSSHQLTVSQMPAHTHNGTTTSGNQMSYVLVYGAGESTLPNYGVGYVPGGNRVINDAKYPLAQHTHNYTTNSVGGGSGHSHALTIADTRPEFLEMFFIVRVK